MPFQEQMDAIDDGDEDCRIHQDLRMFESMSNIDLEFPPFKKSFRKTKGHTNLKRQQKQKVSRNKAVINPPSTPNEGVLEEWMVKINTTMRNSGATDPWNLNDFQVLSDKSRKGQSTWLSDKHFHYFITLFNNQFKHIQPMQYLTTAQATGFVKINEELNFIQAVHVSDHFMVLANLDVPTKERQNTVVTYDSLIAMIGTDRCQIRERVKWQVSQLLKPNTNGKPKGMVLRTSPCQQQKNANDCALYTFANCIALASGYTPAMVCYTGDLRTEFLTMLSEGELKMFLFEPRSEQNESEFCTSTVTSNGPENLPVPEMRHSYDAVCHCGFPETWSNCVVCNTCHMPFHQQCYLVNDESKIMEALPTFQCYQCRVAGHYDFMSNSASNIQVDKNKIDNAVKLISKTLPKRKLDRFLKNVLHQAQNPVTLFFNMTDYKQFEDMCVQYDLNSVGLGVGDLYHAIYEYYHRSIGECDAYYPWEFLSNCHHVHLAALMISEATKVDIPPLWKKDCDIEIDGIIMLSSH